MVEFPESSARTIPASERLHSAITEQRIAHYGDPDLDPHVAAAVAKIRVLGHGQVPIHWQSSPGRLPRLVPFLAHRIA